MSSRLVKKAKKILIQRKKRKAGSKERKSKNFEKNQDFPPSKKRR